ncbi:MAG: vWA domain-containing protein [Promethearchaeota archaeon]
MGGRIITNIFDSDDFSQSEDIVLIIENSPAFYTTDITPNRYEKLLTLLEAFIENRIKLDYRDRYMLLIYNETIYSPNDNFENFAHHLVEQIRQGFDKTETIINDSSDTWAGNFTKALQKGIQKCIASFKQIRNKTLRIIFFTSQLPGLPPGLYNQVKQIIERTAQRLDIIIDTLLVQGSKKMSIFDYENPLKLASDLTGGTYFLITNTREYEEAFEIITKKKEVLRKSYLEQREYTKEKEFLEIIASEMSRITEVLDDAELKCSICFKKDCSHVETFDIIDAYDHLRICPNCKKVMHLCCAGRWAEQQNSKSNFIGFPNVFRCPYCFYLLKVPREFVNFDGVLYQLQERWLKAKEKEEAERRLEEQKEKELHQFFNEVEQQQSDKEKVIQWLKSKCTDKSDRECERIADDIIRIKDKDERESFINYFKFKENIDDDSMPL